MVSNLAEIDCGRRKAVIVFVGCAYNFYGVCSSREIV